MAINTFAKIEPNTHTHIGIAFVLQVLVTATRVTLSSTCISNVLDNAADAKVFFIDGMLEV